MHRSFMVDITNSLTRNVDGQFQGAFGSIDGLNCPIATADDIELENASYNGWLHAHICSNVFVFSPCGKLLLFCLFIFIYFIYILFVTDLLIEGEILAANDPGSWHDSHVAVPIYVQLREDTTHGFYSDQISGRIRAPLKSGQVLPSDTFERQAVLQLNQQLLSY